jgi:prolyl-tRNA editing enzyme YbaK/EbsC (Cys-tRNA(Pro) deacylase)
VLQGSDHGISEFAQYVNEVLAFCTPSKQLPASAQKVQQALDALGLDCQVIALDVAARTAQQAADALGVQVGQIAKSLVFRLRDSGEAALVICAGDRRVDETKVGQLLGQPVERAAPAFVREHTGFAIGGIPPLGHAQPLHVVADQSLERFPTVWAAGGTPHTVFAIAPERLFSLLNRQVGDVTAISV